MKNSKRRIAILATLLLSVSLAVITLLIPPSAEALSIVPNSCSSQSCTLCELFVMITNISNIGISLGGGLAVIGVIMGGLRYITAGSNQALVTKAKDTMKNTAIGLILVLGAWLIITTTLNLLGNNQGSWWKWECQTTDMGSTNFQDTSGRGSNSGLSLDTIKNEKYTSINKYLADINRIGKQYNIDPAYLATLIMMESKGDASALGNDLERYYKRTAKTTTPVTKGLTFKQDAPDMYGLTWGCADKNVCKCPAGESCSWGFGLTQLTIFNYDSASNLGKKPTGNGWETPTKPTYYDETAKKWYTPLQLMDPATNIELAAKLFAMKMKEADNSNQGLKGAFGRWNGGGKWQQNTGREYSEKAMAIYTALSKERGSNVAQYFTGSYFGKNASGCKGLLDYNKQPDPSCKLVTLDTTTVPYLATYTNSNPLVILTAPAMNSLKEVAKKYYEEYKKPLYIISSWRSQVIQQCFLERFGNVQAAPVKFTGLSRSHKSGMSIDIGLVKSGTICNQPGDKSNKTTTSGMTFEEWKWFNTQFGATYTGIGNKDTQKKIKSGTWEVLSPKSTSFGKGKDLRGQFCALEGWHFDYMIQPKQPICLSPIGKEFCRQFPAHVKCN